MREPVFSAKIKMFIEKYSKFAIFCFGVMLR